MNEFNVDGILRYYRKNDKLEKNPQRDTLFYVRVLLPKWKQEHLDYMYKMLPDSEDLAQFVSE